MASWKKGVKQPENIDPIGMPITVLRNISFLQPLDTHELRLFSKLINVRYFKAGEVIFRENYPVAVLYIVAEGEVDIVLENEPLEPIVLNTFGMHNHFGELGLFIETNRTASAIAKKDTVLYAISKKDFEHFIHISPKIGVKILYELGVQLSNHLIRTNALLKKK